MNQILIGFAILIVSFSIGSLDGIIGVWGWVGVPVGGYFVIQGRKKLDINK